MFREGPDIVNDARRASRLVGLEEDVHRLPQGYGSMLGTGISEQLSRGMVQRIVITRALALSPQVLLFDEANAMLDLRSDERLRLGLARLRGTMTIVIVSSRPSLLAVADRNFVLQNGALAHDRPEPSPAQTRSA